MMKEAAMSNRDSIPSYDIQAETPTEDEDEFSRKTPRQGVAAEADSSVRQAANGASSTPPMVPDGVEPMFSASELAERYSTLNLQYWTLLTRMVNNAGMESAPDLWRHRSKRGYRLGDIVRNYVRQSHYRSSGHRKVTMDALLYTARTAYDHVPPRRLLIDSTSTTTKYNDRKSEDSKPYNPANEGMLEWGDLGLEANVFEVLAKDDQGLKDSLGGALPDTGVPPFWMLGVVG